MREEALSHAFLGLPAYGENSRLAAGDLDDAPAHALPQRLCSCGNDMVCGWAGALAGADGINIVSGRGSIATAGLRAATPAAGAGASCWSDERLFLTGWRVRVCNCSPRMSDGRSPRGSLYEYVRRHFSTALVTSISALPSTASWRRSAASSRSSPDSSSPLPRRGTRPRSRSWRAPRGTRGHRRCRAPPTADPRRSTYPGVLLGGHVSTGKRPARAVRVGTAAAVRPVSVRRGVVAAGCGRGRAGRQTERNSLSAAGLEALARAKK